MWVTGVCAWSNTVRCMGRRASNVDFLFLLLSSSLGCYGAQTHIVNERVLCRTNFTSNNFGINELPSRRSDLNILSRMSLGMMHAIASWMAKQSDTQTKYYCRQVMIIIRMSGACYCSSGTGIWQINCYKLKILICDLRASRDDERMKMESGMNGKRAHNHR